MSEHAWLFDAMQALLDTTRTERGVPTRWDISQEHLDALKAELPHQWEAAFGGVPYEVVDAQEGDPITLLVSYQLK